MQQFLESQNFLNTVVEEATKNSLVATELVAGLNEDQLSWIAAPNTWSIAQCLDHLAVTGKEFDSYLPDAIQRGRDKWPTSTAVVYKPSLMGGWLIRQVVPQSTRKFPAPKVFRPSQSPKIEGALEKYLNQQSTFLRHVNSAEGFDYNKTRMRSPVTPLMRYSVADAFVVTVVHGWRHLAQAKRVRETAGFPI